MDHFDKNLRSDQNMVMWGIKMSEILSWLQIWKNYRLISRLNDKFSHSFKIARVFHINIIMTWLDWKLQSILSVKTPISSVYSSHDEKKLTADTKLRNPAKICPLRKYRLMAKTPNALREASAIHAANPLRINQAPVYIHILWVFFTNELLFTQHL